MINNGFIINNDIIYNLYIKFYNLLNNHIDIRVFIEIFSFIFLFSFFIFLRYKFNIQYIENLIKKDKRFNFVIDSYNQSLVLYYLFLQFIVYYTLLISMFLFKTPQLMIFDNAYSIKLLTLNIYTSIVMVLLLYNILFVILNNNLFFISVQSYIVRLIRFITNLMLLVGSFIFFSYQLNINYLVKIEQENIIIIFRDYNKDFQLIMQVLFFANMEELLTFIGYTHPSIMLQRKYSEYKYVFKKIQTYFRQIIGFKILIIVLIVLFYYFYSNSITLLLSFKNIDLLSIRDNIYLLIVLSTIESIIIYFIMYLTFKLFYYLHKNDQIFTKRDDSK